MSDQKDPARPFRGGHHTTLKVETSFYDHSQDIHERNALRASLVEDAHVYISIENEQDGKRHGHSREFADIVLKDPDEIRSLWRHLRDIEQRLRGIQREEDMPT